jgi:hypothetical protein
MAMIAALVIRALIFSYVTFGFVSYVVNEPSIEWFHVAVFVIFVETIGTRRWSRHVMSMLIETSIFAATTVRYVNVEPVTEFSEAISDQSVSEWRKVALFLRTVLFPRSKRERLIELLNMPVRREQETTSVTKNVQDALKRAFVLRPQLTHALLG